MVKTYKYLIYYIFDGGIGSACITFKKEINSFDDLEEIQKDIETKSEIKNVVIANYILVCTSEKNNQINKTK